MVRTKDERLPTGAETKKQVGENEEEHSTMMGGLSEDRPNSSESQRKKRSEEKRSTAGSVGRKRHYQSCSQVMSQSASPHNRETTRRTRSYSIGNGLALSSERIHQGTQPT